MRSSRAFLCIFAIACGNSEPAAQTPSTTASSASAAPVATTSPPPTSSATTAAPVDLSTADKARSAIYDALKRGDKEGFKKLVTKRVLGAQKDNFDAWYGVWKSAADKSPDAFKKITVNQEDGQFKLDEN